MKLSLRWLALLILIIPMNAHAVPISIDFTAEIQAVQRYYNPILNSVAVGDTIARSFFYELDTSPSSEYRSSAQYIFAHPHAGLSISINEFEFSSSMAPNPLGIYIHNDIRNVDIFQVYSNQLMSINVPMNIMDSAFSLALRDGTQTALSSTDLDSTQSLDYRSFDESMIRLRIQTNDGGAWGDIGISASLGSYQIESPSAPAPVPEPATLTLLGLGFLAAATRVGRSKKPRIGS